MPSRRRNLVSLVLAIVLIAISVIILLSPPATEAATYEGSIATVKVTYSRVVIGNYSIVITVTPIVGTNIAGIQMDVELPSNCKIRSIIDGKLLRQEGYAAVFSEGSIKANTSKNIVSFIIGKGGITTPGTFAIIKCKRLAKGSTAATISNMILGNSEGEEVVYTTK